jgi:peptidoglycan/LPS O-acetylase OafA/YrhL
VIFSHSIILGGYRSEILWGHGTLGDIAVDAFFAVSGFLIAASAVRNNVVRYLWQRFLRIFPAFWVCLIVTAALAGPIGWVADGHPLNSYWGNAEGPVHYIVSDWLLVMNSYGIAGTPAHIPWQGAWDGSLWTLRYEFYCYLMVGAFAVTTLLRRRLVMLVLWAFSWALALGTAAARLQTSQPTFHHELVRFIPIFFAGAVLWLYRDKIPDSPVLFAGALLVFAVGTFLRNPDVVAGPPLAYLCVWASIHLPGKRIGARYDISYGTYIYAFLVAQTLALWHVYRWGYFPFTFVTMAVTLVLAGLSCVVVERPALRLKRWSPAFMAAGSSHWSQPDQRPPDQRPQPEQPQPDHRPQPDDQGPQFGQSPQPGGQGPQPGGQGIARNHVVASPWPPE